MPLLVLILALSLGHPQKATAPVPTPEQQPIPVVLTTDPAPEVKPLPAIEPVVKATACNCYTILTENYREVPPMNEIIATATSTVGNVAVFAYPPSLNFPDGTPHVAIVRQVLPDGSIQIEEYNYHSCTHSFRTISPTDKRLVGFINLIPLSPSLLDGYTGK